MKLKHQFLMLAIMSIIGTIFTIFSIIVVANSNFEELLQTQIITIFCISLLFFMFFTAFFAIMYFKAREDI